MDLINITIPCLLREQSEKYKDKVFLEYFGDTYTYLETDLLSDLIMEKLEALNVKKGDRVAIWSENSPVWLLYFIAIQKLEAIPVLINTSYKLDELEKVLLISEVSHIVHGAGHKDVNYKDVLFSLKLRGKVNIQNYIELPQSIKTDLSGRKLLPLRKVDCMSPALIMFTSGSTNVPKGVLLSHHSLVNNARGTAIDMGWTNVDRSCLAVPFFHCFGLTTGFLCMLSIGGTLNILHVFRTRSVLECIERNKCTILNGVPSMFLSIIRNGILRDYDLTSLESGVVAGAPISKEDYLKICSILDMRLEQSYGQTETSPCITITNKEDDVLTKSSSSGRVCANQELRIVDSLTREKLGFLKIGEIEVKGYNVMLGYDHLEEETKKVISPDGFLSTGDLGFLSEDGNLHITGRKSEIIIRGGENISPVEIEYCIGEIPTVEEVKVISVPDPVMNEEIAAAITLEKDTILREDYVKRFVSERLASFKVPKYVFFLNEFPKLENGKINLRELKSLLINKIKNKTTN